MARGRSEVEAEVESSRRFATTRLREVYLALGMIGAIFLYGPLSRFLLGFLPGWVAEVLAVGVVLFLVWVARMVAFRLPAFPRSFAAKEVLYGESRVPGQALAWMATSPSCPARLRRYLAAELSPAELEVFLVLAEDSDLCVDDLIGVVRSL